MLQLPGVELSKSSHYWKAKVSIQQHDQCLYCDEGFKNVQETSALPGNISVATPNTEVDKGNFEVEIDLLFGGLGRYEEIPYLVLNLKSEDNYQEQKDEFVEWNFQNRNGIPLYGFQYQLLNQK